MLTTISSSPPTFNISQHLGLFNESVLRIRWPKYWSFSFNISPTNEDSGLISLRMDWLDILAVQGTLKSLLQNHSSKSINSLILSFLYSPTLTSIDDYWKNHSLDKVDLYWQINVSAFFFFLLLQSHVTRLGTAIVTSNNHE